MSALHLHSDNLGYIYSYIHIQFSNSISDFVNRHQDFTSHQKTEVTSYLHADLYSLFEQHLTTNGSVRIQVRTTPVTNQKL